MDKNNVHVVLNRILRIALEQVSLETILSETIKEIVSIPWFALEPKGAIFLVEDDPNVLVLKAHENLPDSLVKMCGHTPFGRCLCGKAADSGEVLYADRVDEKHQNIYEGILPHGHYCVPVKLNDRVIGILTLYIKEGHKFESEEQEFLIAIANVVANVVSHKRMEDKFLQSEKLASLGTMAATVAHDLRQPQTVIKAALYNIQNKLKDDARKIDSDLVIIKRQIEYEDRIINNLLGFSRPQKTILKGVNLNDILRKAVDTRCGADNAKCCPIKLIEGDIPEVKADPTQIEQVIHNLFNNACDATDETGKITVKTKYIEKENSVEISVSDTGHGISEDDLKNLGKPFFSTKEHGTGLGLALCYYIVQSIHKGSIRVISEVDKGAEFIITIPL